VDTLDHRQLKGADVPEKIEIRTGTCPVHGTVAAERRMPRPSFPFVVYAVQRALAASRPYRCPDCGEPVEA
jgi:hypothetical protein